MGALEGASGSTKCSNRHSTCNPSLPQGPNLLAYQLDEPCIQVKSFGLYIKVHLAPTKYTEGEGTEEATAVVSA